MTDWLSVVERGLKAVRFGIFQASDNLAMLLDGFCRAPEYPAVVASNERVAAAIAYARNNPPSSAPADYPLAGSVVAPSPKQGSDSGPADSDILTSPAGPHPQEVIGAVLSHHRLTWHVKRIECWDDDYGTTSCGWFESSEQWREHVAELIAWKLFGEPA